MIILKEQKETTFYTLVCGLAVTDLLGTLLASPVTIATYVKGSWPGRGDALCQYSGFILLFFSLAGLSIICAMSIERTSLGTDQRRIVDLRRRRSFGRMAGAEIQMVILLIATSVVMLICSIPLVVRVFVNQLYKTKVEGRIENNPDLQAIRIASVNPILDPWIYILLRKAVLLKLIEKLKCLFCRIGGQHQQRPGNFHCIDGQRSSSVISRDSPSLVSRELREVTSTSQTFLYLLETSDSFSGSCRLGQAGPRPALERASLKDFGGSECSNVNSNVNCRTSEGQHLGGSESDEEEERGMPMPVSRKLTDGLGPVGWCGQGFTM
ncbi:hypothetical protein SKAU_G00361340 [Synaphobranchus kaupii]|uniref:G-protein coupled receptors family 1 profile domain-containing protein n=1 Tax=Synaphobranchus kaupii TaxID=118154 RepID=A0A9Q1EIF8_SYNKA|nr:hypothetical protein SKAU_G00361340 [Synaphobranchus kaupii]